MGDVDVEKEVDENEADAGRVDVDNVVAASDGDDVALVPGFTGFADNVCGVSVSASVAHVFANVPDDLFDATDAAAAADADATVVLASVGWLASNKPSNFKSRLQQHRQMRGISSKSSSAEALPPAIGGESCSLEGAVDIASAVAAVAAVAVSAAIELAADALRLLRLALILF